MRNVIRTVIDKCMQQVEIMIKGLGLGKYEALSSIPKSLILLKIIRDVTPMPHNGCEALKKDV